MTNDPETSLERWIADTAERCARNLRLPDDAGPIAEIRTTIARQLRQLPPDALEQLMTELRDRETASRLAEFGRGEAAHWWAQGVDEALRINGFPAVMETSRDPERFEIGKKWFESVTGAAFETDLVELKTEVALPRHMLVAQVRIEVPRDASADTAYAVLAGRVLRPYQISPQQRFYPGDTLRKVLDTELTPKELKALERARAILKDELSGNAQQDNRREGPESG